MFFPLQIPDDESLQFGSAHSLFEIVRAVVRWAEAAKVRVLFKRHPLRSVWWQKIYPLASPYVKVIVHGDIHDLLQRAKVVFVANSGVGFEAMLYGRPVVTFARALYDVVTVRAGGLDGVEIQKCYELALQREAIESSYLQWIEWFIFEHGCLMDGDLFKFSLPDGREVEIDNPYMARIRDWRQFISDWREKSIWRKFIQSRHIMLPMPKDEA